MIFLSTHDAEVPSILSGCSGAKQEAAGGGKRRENDKHEHGGSWGQLKIAQRRGGKSDGETTGTTVRETEAGLFLVVLRMKCFAVGTEERRGKEKKKKLLQLSACSLSQIKQWLFWERLSSPKVG